MMKDKDFYFERMGTPNHFRVFKREPTCLSQLGDVFRYDGERRRWFVNVAPTTHIIARLRGEPVIGTIRGPFTSRVKAAVYLHELPESQRGA